MAYAPTGSTASSADTIAFQSVPGSLSSESHDTHDAVGWTLSAHCESNVVLPYPGGATTVSSGSGAASMRRTSAVRGTSPRRATGGRSLGPMGMADGPDGGPPRWVGPPKSPCPSPLASTLTKLPSCHP
jgi:hypothetical protein